MGLGQVRAGQDADVEPGLGLAPLAANGLAAAGRQGGEEVVKRPVVSVAPDELHVLPLQQTGLSHRLPFGLGREIDV